MGQSHHEPPADQSKSDRHAAEVREEEDLAGESGASKADRSVASGVDTEAVQPGKTGGASSQH